MFQRIKGLFRRQSLSAATPMPSDPPPVVKGKQQALPSYLTTAKPSKDAALQRTDRLLANTDVLTYRQGNDSRKVIRDFRRSSPDLSAAVTAYIRTGITTGYTAIARNPDGTVNPEATSALAQILTRMNVLNDYTIGYDDGLSIRSLSEVWAGELVTTGACCGELVLDKARLPEKIQPVSSSQILFYPSGDGKKLIPKQKVGGEEISLDVPTFFMVTLDQDLLEVYPISPIEPAIQAVLFSAEFMNDIRRVIKKAIHPRVVVTINEEKFRKSIPPEYQNDTEKLNNYMAEVVSDLEEQLNGLEPEEALVIFDTLGIDIADHGNTNLSKEYEVLQGLADAKLASGAKALPTVLGQSNATASVASAEVLMFLKLVEGTVWAKLNEMFSKTFTLAVRLLGHDVYVEFAYNTIELKPESELEAFRSMKQSRVLGLLSLGLMSDEEASIALTGHLPPAGYKPLAGTGFMPNTGADPVGDGYNGASNKGSAMNQKTAPSTPTGAKSQNGGKKAETDVIQLVAVQ